MNHSPLLALPFVPVVGGGLVGVSVDGFADGLLCLNGPIRVCYEDVWERSLRVKLTAAHVSSLLGRSPRVREHLCVAVLAQAEGDGATVLGGQLGRGPRGGGGFALVAHDVRGLE